MDHSNSKKAEIKTLCTKCQNPITCSWPEEMDLDGKKVTAWEFMSAVLMSEDAEILCDECSDEFDYFNIFKNTDTVETI
jgi:hypothetical protein